MPTKFRSLVEFSCEPTEYYKHEYNKLREYKNMNETKYKKNRYPNDDTKRKQKIPEVTEKENTGTTNLKQYRKGTYDNEKDSQSNIYSRSTKYLEIQRKLYNNFYVKPEMDFQYFSDKSNDKSNKCCECLNKKKSYDELSSSTKFHYNYLDNSKKVCAVDVCACFLSSAATGIAGNIPPTFAAAKAAVTSLESALQTSYSTAVLTKLSNALASVNLSSQSAIVGAIISGVILGVSSATASSTTVAKAATAAASTTFFPYGMTIVALILLTIAMIVLYIWLRRRRKNSWKHEWKKHLCK